MKNLAIGVDIGGTRTKIGLVDLHLGQVLEIQILATETKNVQLFEQDVSNFSAPVDEDFGRFYFRKIIEKRHQNSFVVQNISAYFDDN